MTQPALTASLLAERAGAPTLVVGPSLGTSVRGLWMPAVPALAERFQVIGWDLPGHGASAPSTEPFTIAELAAGVADLIRAQRTAGVIGDDERVFVAGDSVGGGTTLQLALDHPELVAGAAPVCASARFGTREAWLERAEFVRQAGTPAMVTGSAQRWFAEGFIEREPERTTTLLHDLQHADRFAYAAVCEALADFDLTGRLAELTVPVFAIGGAEDAVCSPREQRRIAEGAPQGDHTVIPGVAHQAPVEAPELTASLLIEFFLGETAAVVVESVPDDGATGAATVTGAPALADTGTAADTATSDSYDAGMAVRREVLGDAHVDRATAAIDDVTRDFQALITRYAWGTIWTRPGLPRETRSAITMTALIAGGYWQEYEMHVRAALRIGLTRDEIVEVALQSAVYCAVPAANHALGIVQRVCAEGDSATH